MYLIKMKVNFVFLRRIISEAILALNTALKGSFGVDADLPRKTLSHTSQALIHVYKGCRREHLFCNANIGRNLEIPTFH